MPACAPDRHPLHLPGLARHPSVGRLADGLLHLPGRAQRDRARRYYSLYAGALDSSGAAAGVAHVSVTRVA